LSQRSIRYLFRIGIALIWLLVFLLGAEFAERARGVIAERFYQRFFEAQTRKVYRMVPEEERTAAANEFRMTEKERASYDATSDEVPPAGACMENGPERATARAAFAQGDLEKSAIVATLEGTFTARFTQELRLLEHTGEPQLEEHFLRAVRRGNLANYCQPLAHLVGTMKPGAPTESFSFNFLNLYTVQGELSRAEDGVFVLRLREVPPVFVSPDPPFGPEVATEISSVRYKRNWRRDGQMATYNNFGFRDDDVVVPKPVGLYRIVCIGGSTTEEGNSNELTYPNLVEKSLLETFAPRKVEVINCGISGITSYNERRRFDDYLALEPDLVVYYNGINDVTHELWVDWMEQVTPERDTLLRSKLLTRIYNRSLLPEDSVLIESMRRTTFRNIRAMAQRARECGAAFAVCSFAYPDPEQLGFRDRVYLDIHIREVCEGHHLNYDTYAQVMGLYNRLVREVCEADGLHYIPVAEHMEKGLDHFFDACHMTPLGMALKVSIISPHLRAIVDRALNR